MMPEPATRSNRQYCDDLRFHATPLLIPANSIRVDRAVGLPEFLEDLGLIDRRNIGARVAYRNRERTVRCRCSDRYLALIGELDRVADEVEQHLREQPFIPRVELARSLR
jgi:hypothetical protein